ncbi:MAG: Crp/Fnr family transcriptional regulator [Ghiorsea sp.]
MSQNIPLEHGFSPSDFPEARSVCLAKGDLFLYEGDEHHKTCFLILTGKMDVRLISGSGHETLLYHLYPGELVGELAMFGVSERTATIMASEKTQLLEVSYAEFSKLIKQYDFLEKITHLFIERYLRTHEVVCRLGQPNIGMKLCRYFKSLTDQYDTDAKRVKLKLPSHVELGQLLSCQRETITRELKKLVNAGIITPDGGSIFYVESEKMKLYLADMLD